MNQRHACRIKPGLCRGANQLFFGLQGPLQAGDPGLQALDLVPELKPEGTQSEHDKQYQQYRQ